MNVLEAMHADVKSASPEASVQEIARLMAENDIGAIPISKDGHLVGIVTDRDIVIRAVVKSLDLGKTTAGDIMTEHVVFCKIKMQPSEPASVAGRCSASVAPSARN